jgi:hypothetical protein
MVFNATAKNTGNQGCSFLKKRTKKLLSIAGSTRAARVNHLPDAMGKSFLLLFFKKEGLPFLPYSAA